MSYNKIISNVEELKWFFNNIIPELKSLEVIFLSLSARNKYLNTEEKIEFELGRNEMFQKTIVREKTWEKFYRTIRKLECHKDGYVTKNGKSIPNKALVCYININPSNTLKALNEFNKVINEYMFEFSMIATEGRNSENILNRMNKIDNNLMTAYQQSTGSRHWIDFDLDINKHWEVYEEEVLKDWLVKKGIKTYYWIDTKSGYHLLIKKDELKFNPKELCDYIRQGYSNWVYSNWDLEIAKQIVESAEIIKNDNAMIPCPGTFQGEYPVRILNKDVL